MCKRKFKEQFMPVKKTDVLGDITIAICFFAFIYFKFGELDIDILYI